MKTETDLFSKQLLTNKFPGLTAEIEQGNFRIVSMEEGSTRELIVRFAPTIQPSVRIVEHILSDLFSGYPEDKIIFRLTLQGLEIVADYRHATGVFSLPV